MKHYYTDYVGHMIRFYASTKGEKPENFKSVGSKRNWDAVAATVVDLGQDRFEMCLKFYTYEPGVGLFKKIERWCEEHPGAEPKTVYRLLQEFEFRCAELRGLI